MEEMEINQQREMLILNMLIFFGILNCPFPNFFLMTCECPGYSNKCLLINITHILTPTMIASVGATWPSH